MIPSSLIANDETKEVAMRHLEKQFDMNTSQLKRISELLQEEMETGLHSKEEDCNVPMLPTFINRHPTGQEKGEYLGLDLSGKVSII
jgi:hexokinase